ncbi:MAG: aromatic ring-hydroxylating dioxygenase subunit alpha [Acidimicrobiaceae bacterium]|nr:aromatic ring-hydroxylating dioxygenase subunit alpha [Acidimicrobiaceae bacterium]MXY09330.1 aromatic ring-hydroxylating dioxygenase subunit alpha [Acidimicrobiaceae bacterium]MYF33623.1 aromatic ring-hydroxylating dioxygenase subunit alpha [Acidimicrobiaceae bacterium]MYG78498.1 aromatic ring-hydroxylating dioxygenase subunit alpha [Acidimicrobiaceae bacterium]
MTTERPGGLAGRYYTDSEIFAAEMDSVFARNWVMVGHASEVAEPGTVITARVGDESVLVANDAGQLRAMFNVCQHRGHELVTSTAARLDRITCPYHAWTYSLDGRLLHARGEDVGDVCVPRVRLETLAGFLFVNLSLEAAGLAATAPGVQDDLLVRVPDAPRRVLSARLTHEMRANWKVVVENYNECYHCPNVHKWFTSGVVAPGSYRIASGGSVIHHAAERPSQPPAWTDAGADGEPAEAGHGDAAGTRASNGAGVGDGYEAYFVWPVSAIQCYPGQVINTFRWVPLAVDRTLLIREWWFDTADLTEAQSRLVSDDWENTVAEDFGIVESVQRGVASRGYTPGPLIEDPSGVCGVHSENSVRHLQDLARASLDGAV